MARFERYNLEACGVALRLPLRALFRPTREANERDTAGPVFGLLDHPTCGAFPAEASGIVPRSSPVTAARQRRICTDFPCIQPPRPRLPSACSVLYLPMTVAQALAETQATLQGAGIPEARREAELLVAAALGVERAYLIAHPEAPLSAQHCARLRCWTRRRAAHEPLAYITRRVWFYGLPLHIRRGALIPRPETEHLVELFLRWAQRQEFAQTPVLVDAGTGSGAIAVACLLHAPRWHAIGIDCSRRALRIAAHNRHKFGLQHRLLLVQGDWLAALRSRSVDAVLANPPYVLPDEWDSLQPEIRRYEPRQALLVPADDPLRPYREIAQAAQRVLRSPGLLAFETSPRLAPQLASKLPTWGFAQLFTCADYSGMQRVVGATV